MTLLSTPHEFVLVAMGFIGGVMFAVLVVAVIVWEVDIQDAMNERNKL